MFDLEKIKEFYPQNIRRFERHIIREYLQCKILEIIYNSKFAKDLVFLGGTALRIGYNNQRFSEDLDFDNLGLTESDFHSLSSLVKEQLRLEGCDVEARVVIKNSFRCYIKISSLLFDEGISSHSDEKITIQIDTFPQNYQFTPRLFTLDKFDVYTKIKIVPADLLLAQKIVYIFNRKRRMGRDFFDVSFLLENVAVKPDFNYLNVKLGVKNEAELILMMKRELQDVDFDRIADDVEFLLMKNNHKDRVSNFYRDVVEGFY